MASGFYVDYFDNYFNSDLLLVLIAYTTSFKYLNSIMGPLFTWIIPLFHKEFSIGAYLYIFCELYTNILSIPHHLNILIQSWDLYLHGLFHYVTENLALEPTYIYFCELYTNTFVESLLSITDCGLT